MAKITTILALLPLLLSALVYYALNYTMAEGMFFPRNGSAEAIMRGVDLSGKTALVTGANRGLGFGMARLLAQAGAEVLMTCRSLAKCEGAIQTIKQEYPAAKLTPFVFDASSIASAFELSDAVSAKYATLDLLVLNAGNMAQTYSTTPEGLEHDFAVFVAGNYVLIETLGASVRAAKGRLMTVSSMMVRICTLDLNVDSPLVATEATFDKMTAYADSKLVLHMLATDFETRFGPDGVHAYATCPGGTRTGAQDAEMPGFVADFVFKKLDVGLASMVMPLVLPAEDLVGWQAPRLIRNENVDFDPMGCPQYYAVERAAAVRGQVKEVLLAASGISADTRIRLEGL